MDYYLAVILLELIDLLAIMAVGRTVLAGAKLNIVVSKASKLSKLIYSFILGFSLIYLGTILLLLIEPFININLIQYYFHIFRVLGYLILLILGINVIHKYRNRAFEDFLILLREYSRNIPFIILIAINTVIVLYGFFQPRMDWDAINFFLRDAVAIVKYNNMNAWHYPSTLYVARPPFTPNSLTWSILLGFIISNPPLYTKLLSGSPLDILFSINIIFVPLALFLFILVQAVFYLILSKTLMSERNTKIISLSLFVSTPFFFEYFLDTPLNADLLYLLFFLVALDLAIDLLKEGNHTISKMTLLALLLSMLSLTKSYGLVLSVGLILALMVSDAFNRLEDIGYLLSLVFLVVASSALSLLFLSRDPWETIKFTEPSGIASFLFITGFFLVFFVRSISRKIRLEEVKENVLSITYFTKQYFILFLLFTLFTIPALPMLFGIYSAYFGETNTFEGKVAEAFTSIGFGKPSIDGYPSHSHLSVLIDYKYIPMISLAALILLLFTSASLIPVFFVSLSYFVFITGSNCFISPRHYFPLYLLFFILFILNINRILKNKTNIFLSFLLMFSLIRILGYYSLINKLILLNYYKDISFYLSLFKLPNVSYFWYTPFRIILLIAHSLFIFLLIYSVSLKKFDNKGYEGILVISLVFILYILLPMVAYVPTAGYRDKYYHYIHGGYLDLLENLEMKVNNGTIAHFYGYGAEVFTRFKYSYVYMLDYRQLAWVLRNKPVAVYIVPYRNSSYHGRIFWKIVNKLQKDGTNVAPLDILSGKYIIVSYNDYFLAYIPKEVQGYPAEMVNLTKKGVVKGKASLSYMGNGVYNLAINTTKTSEYGYMLLHLSDFRNFTFELRRVNISRDSDFSSLLKIYLGNINLIYISYKDGHYLLHLYGLNTLYSVSEINGMKLNIVLVKTVEGKYVCVISIKTPAFSDVYVLDVRNDIKILLGDLSTKDSKGTLSAILFVSSGGNNGQ